MSQIVKYRYIIAIVVVFLFSFFLRLNNVSFWRSGSFSKVFYYDGKPLLTGWDGYYYARYARELINGEYKKVDDKRNFPEYTKRPSPPPLISIIGAGVVKTIVEKRDRGYIFAALAGICFYLFHWWWTPSYTFLIPGLIVALIMGLLFYSSYPALLKIIMLLLPLFLFI